MGITNVELYGYKHCKQCGKKLVKAGIAKYDQYTGKPVYYRVCPTDKCYHTGVDHNMVRIGWFKEQCTKCGYIPFGAGGVD